MTIAQALLAAYLVVLSNANYEFEVDNPCLKYPLNKRSTGVFPDPRNPNGYLNCDSEGRAVGVLCPVGFRFSAIQSACVPRVSVVDDQVVEQGCKDGCVHGRCDQREVCICNPGYEGIRCDKRVDMCLKEGYQQCGLRGICRNEYGTYVCLCKNGKIGANCEEYSVDNPCTVDALSSNMTNFPLHSAFDKRFIKCVAPFTFSVFECPQGERFDPHVGRCVELGSCSLNGCQNGGQCIEMPPAVFAFGNTQIKQEHPNFKCRCKPGFVGDLCEQKLDFCLSNPCRIGRCESGLFGAVCVCPDKIISDHCETGIDNPCHERNNDEVFEVITRISARDNSFIYCHSNGYASLIHCPQNTTFNKRAVACDTDETRRLRKELELAKETVYIWPDSHLTQQNVPSSQEPIQQQRQLHFGHDTNSYDRIFLQPNNQPAINGQAQSNYVNSGEISNERKVFSNQPGYYHSTSDVKQFNPIEHSPLRNQKYSDFYQTSRKSDDSELNQDRNRRSLEEWDTNTREALNKFSNSIRRDYEQLPGETMNLFDQPHLFSKTSTSLNPISKPLNQAIEELSQRPNSMKQSKVYESPLSIDNLNEFDKSANSLNSQSYYWSSDDMKNKHLPIQSNKMVWQDQTPFGMRDGWTRHSTNSPMTVQDYGQMTSGWTPQQSAGSPMTVQDYGQMTSGWTPQQSAGSPMTVQDYGQMTSGWTPQQSSGSPMTIQDYGQMTSGWTPQHASNSPMTIQDYGQMTSGWTPQHASNSPITLQDYSQMPKGWTPQSGSNMPSPQLPISPIELLNRNNQISRLFNQLNSGRNIQIPNKSSTLNSIYDYFRRKRTLENSDEQTSVSTDMTNSTSQEN